MSRTRVYIFHFVNDMIFALLLKIQIQLPFGILVSLFVESISPTIVLNHKYFWHDDINY